MFLLKIEPLTIHLDFKGPQFIIFTYLESLVLGHKRRKTKNNSLRLQSKLYYAVYTLQNLELINSHSYRGSMNFFTFYRPELPTLKDDSLDLGFSALGSRSQCGFISGPGHSRCAGLGFWARRIFFSQRDPLFCSANFLNSLSFTQLRSDLRVTLRWRLALL